MPMGAGDNWALRNPTPTLERGGGSLRDEVDSGSLKVTSSETDCPSKRDHLSHQHLIPLPGLNMFGNYFVGLLASLVNTCLP